VMKMMLKGKCNLDTASNANAGIELAARKKYAMILMDINLGGGMNGIEATKEIRKMPGYGDTLIIAVTAYTNESDVKMFLQEGCSQFLAKPFSKQQIIDLLKQI
ncbi:MAG: response regulator, partial [Syntrophothermus sp.]